MKFGFERVIIIIEKKRYKLLRGWTFNVWLYKYGHNQNDDKTFSYEDVCEVVASSNDFINEVVNKYSKIEEEIIIHGVEGTRLLTKSWKVCEQRQTRVGEWGGKVWLEAVRKRIHTKWL